MARSSAARRRLIIAWLARLIAVTVAVATLYFLLDDAPRRPRRISDKTVPLPSNPEASQLPTASFVMADSRSIGHSLADASFLTLAVALNFVYAKRYGYDFAFYRLPPRARSQCEHPTLKQKRGASWCKL